MSYSGVLMTRRLMNHKDRKEHREKIGASNGLGTASK